VASELGGIISAVDNPAAPSAIASATSAFILSICASLGRSNNLPITHSQTCPWPTYEATLTEIPPRSTAAK
jgi:hypothetical protein